MSNLNELKMVNLNELKGAIRWVIEGVISETMSKLDKEDLLAGNTTSILASCGIDACNLVNECLDTNLANMEFNNE